MPAQSFGGAHRGRVCGCAFIGMSVCACIWALVSVLMFKKRHCFWDLGPLSKVKTQNPWSGDDNACALFPFWRCRFWRTSYVVRMLSLVVVRVLLMWVFHHCHGVFVFIFLSFSFLFLVVCIFDVFRCFVGAEARCNWYLFHQNKKMACLSECIMFFILHLLTTSILLLVWFLTIFIHINSKFGHFEFVGLLALATEGPKKEKSTLRQL